MNNERWYLGEIANHYQVTSGAVSRWNLPPPTGSDKYGRYWNPATIKKWYKKTETGETQRTKTNRRAK